MNAKQIADELENIYWIQGDGKGKPFQQYADFVRQQQAQIEALKKEAALQRLSDFTQEADNEPIAWMHQNPDYPISKHSSLEYNIPLYTYEQITPSGFLNASKPIYPAKTLTDEEIEDFTVRIYNCRTGAEAHEIVLAILRKAQDK